MCVCVSVCVRACVRACVLVDAGLGGMQVARSTDFRRDGFDIHSDVAISFSQVSACDRHTQAMCTSVCAYLHV